MIENIAEPQPISESDIQGDSVMAEQLVEMNQQLENPNEAIALFGVNDAHLKVIERELSVSIVTRGESVRVSGADETVVLVEKILQQLLVAIINT